jgi:hypothetical protein
MQSTGSSTRSPHGELPSEVQLTRIAHAVCE